MPDRGSEGPQSDDLTTLLNRVAGGRPAPSVTSPSAPEGFDAPAEQLYALVHEVVRRIRRPRSDHRTPETTDLVHRVWERTLLGRPGANGDGGDGGEEGGVLPADAPRWRNREHFFNVVAAATVRALIDEHRRLAATRRGGGETVQSLDALPAMRLPAESGAEARSPADLDPEALVDLLETLESFSELDPRASTVVMLRFLAGLTVDEVALATGCSPATVQRDWRAARAWLYAQLSDRWPELVPRS